MKRRSSANQGFTLLELMVAIAIIAILASLLLTVVSRAKGHAQRSVCLNNLKQINFAVHLYADEHNNILLPAYVPITSPQVLWWFNYVPLVRSYVGLKGEPSPDDHLFACPADSFYYDNNDERLSRGMHLQRLSNYASYGFNAGNVLQLPGVAWPGVAGKKMNAIREPAKTMLVEEFAPLAPFSWHEPVAAHHVVNARGTLGFADGRVSYTKIYWDSAHVTANHLEAWQYDPPADYDYKWRGLRACPDISRPPSHAGGYTSPIGANPRYPLPFAPS